MKLITITFIFSIAIFISACAPGGGPAADTANAANTGAASGGGTTEANANANANTANTNANAAKTPEAVALPKYEKDEEYRAFRDKLIKAGWTPYKAKDADGCGEGDARCEGMPEMQSCAGTGLGNCRYLWKKGSKTIVIGTISDEPIIQSINWAGAGDLSKADKNDTSWRGSARIHEPPTNIRESPGGKVICVIREQKMITINGSTNIEDENGEWIRTNACGKPGVVHSSQIIVAN